MGGGVRVRWFRLRYDLANLKGGKGPEVVRMAEDSGELECNI